MLNSSKLYSIDTIVKEYELPVCIQKPNWTGDFYFRIEKIEGNKVKGTAFKNGQIRTRFFGGGYEYLLSEEAHLYGNNTPLYDKDGFDKKGYDKDGFNRNGYNAQGYNRKGFDKNGFNSQGFDAQGYDRNGYNKEGFNRQGYNSGGYDKYGYDIKGFNKSGIHKTTKTKYDPSGRDVNGNSNTEPNDSFVVNSTPIYHRKFGKGVFKGFSESTGFFSKKYIHVFFKDENREIKFIYPKDIGTKIFLKAPADMVFPSQEETADKGYQGETENFISRKTVLYVSVNGIWKESRFLRFDIKNGKKVVYVNCGGTESFYAYPSKYVKTKYEDVKKANAEKKIKESKYIPENLEAIAIANAYKKYPASHRPSEIAENEKEHELEYHSRVDKKLDELDDAAHAQLSEAYDLERKSRDTLRQAYIDERESDAGFDPFNMGFLMADSYHAESARKERKAHERINEIYKTRQEPYFVRMDCGRSAADLHTVYMGNSDIGELVVDWRNSSVGNAYYYSDMLQNSAEIIIALKRIMTFEAAKLLSFTDEINKYFETDNSIDNATNAVTDSLFLTLLKESRKDEYVHDIIRTIQQNQYRIITSDFNQHALINGCAGSGKTMIMYHRLSYMAYNDANNFSAKNVYAVTPSALFVSLSDELIDKLKLREINNCTYGITIYRLIGRYKNKYKIVAPELFNDITSDTETASAEFLADEQYSAFRQKVNDILDDPSDFCEWFLSEINKRLSCCGFETIEETEFYKRLSMRRDLASLISDRIHGHYDVIKEVTKTVKSKETGYNVDVKTKEVTNKVLDLKRYSWENIEKMENIKSGRIRILNKYRSAFDEILNSQTYSTKEGKPHDFPVSWFDDESALSKALTLLKLEKAVYAFQEFFNNPKKYPGIYLYICQYAFSDIKENAGQLVYKIYTLRTMAEKLNKLTEERTLFFVDEFQNYSGFELETLRCPFSNCVFNLYGDYDQRLDSKGISTSYFKEKFGGEEYVIAENYRNAFEITEYINKKLGKNMLPIGLHGSVNETSLSSCKFKISGRTAIIVHGETADTLPMIRNVTSTLINEINPSNMTIDPKRLNLLSVTNVKGLEFETVYVLDKDMIPNEQYVAYTRALRDLTIIKD